MTALSLENFYVLGMNMLLVWKSLAWISDADYKKKKKKKNKEKNQKHKKHNTKVKLYL